MLLFRVIAGKKGATPLSPLLLQSEEKEPVAERPSLGTENKGNYGPLYEEPSISRKVTEHSKRCLSNLSSSRQRKITLSFWLSLEKSLARKGGEPFFPAITLSPLIDKSRSSEQRDERRIMRYLNVTKESIEKGHELPVAIDPGKKTCGVVIMHPETNNHSIIKSLEIENCSLKETEALIREAEKTADKFGCKPVFIFEATSVLWRPLFAYLQNAGYLCHTVSGSQTNSSRKTKMRKTQTDEIDAVQIAKLYKQGHSHPTKILSEPLMSMRELTRLYSFLLDIRGNIYNRMKNLSFQLFPELESCFSGLFIKTSKVLMEKELVNPETLSTTRIDRLANILKKASRGKFELSKAKELKEKAVSSFGMKKGAPGFSCGLSLLVSLVNSIDSLLVPLEEKIDSLLVTIPQKLTTFPGLDTIGAATFISELGNPVDFSNKDQVIAWFGLDVVWRISAGRGKGWHISKAGTPYGRRWLYLTAGEFVRFFPPAKTKYLRLRKTSTHKKALSVIAADCAEILFAMYRDNSCFNPDLYH